MKYTIRLVNSQQQQWKTILIALQKLCLPQDDVFPVDVGWWHIVRDSTGRYVGFCGLVPSQRWTDCVYLCRAGVIPAARGHGLQKKMIRVRLQKAKKLGYKWAVTDTYENPPSANSLISAGFKMFTPSNAWAGEGAIHWRRAL